MVMTGGIIVQVSVPQCTSETSAHDFQGRVRGTSSWMNRPGVSTSPKQVELLIKGYIYILISYEFHY